jgi:transposase
LFKKDKFISDDELMTNDKVDSNKIKKLGIEPKVTVILKKKDDRYYPIADESLDDLVGADVNFKHNAVALDDGTDFDWDRQLLKKLTEQYKQIEGFKKDNKDYKPGKKREKKIDAIKGALRQYLITLAKDICEYMVSKGKRHIVFENIDGQFEKNFIKDCNFDDVRINKILRDIGIAEIKNVVTRIGRKYDICVSIVPSEYTSQLCCDCWTIDEENRPSQEVFKCVKCGHEGINADTHGASVIKTYVKSTVLREALLDKNPNGTGTYLPKDLTHS